MFQFQFISKKKEIYLLAFLVLQCKLEIDLLGSLQVKIQKDSEVRLKIIGTRVDATEIVSIYLMNLNYSNL